MENILYTLPIGIVIIAISFMLVYRFTRMGGKMTAATMAIAVAIIYFSVAAIKWPGADVFAVHIALFLVLVYVLGIITSQRDAHKLAGGERGSNFHWGPASITTFFLFIIVADSFFIMLAIKGVPSDMARWLLPEPRSGATVSSYFPGTVQRNYKEKYSEYNEYLRQVEEQNKLHWHISKGWLVEPVAGKPAVFRVMVLNKDNQPLTGAEISGVFLRPGNTKLDQAFTMKEVKGFMYETEVILPKHGSWDLDLTIKHQQDIHHLVASTTVAE